MSASRRSNPDRDSAERSAIAKLAIISEISSLLCLLIELDLRNILFRIFYLADRTRINEIDIFHEGHSGYFSRH